MKSGYIVTVLYSDLKRVAVGTQARWTRQKREECRNNMATGSLNIRRTNIEWTR